LNWGLDPPRVSTGEQVTGANKRQLRRENKAKRIRMQEAAAETSFWATHAGEFELGLWKMRKIGCKNSPIAY
jgi:hypothetical protein